MAHSLAPHMPCACTDMKGWEVCESEQAKDHTEKEGRVIAARKMDKFNSVQSNIFLLDICNILYFNPF